MAQLEESRMNIKVNADYRITSDERNVIVNRRHMSDPTKSPRWAELAAKGASPKPTEKWKEVSYHHRIEQALEWIVDQQIRDSDAESLEELVGQIAGFQREIKAAIGR
jgi:hypothetical protein